MMHPFTTIDDWFEADEVADRVYRIRERYYRDDYRCNIYLIQGSERDVVIDSGLGLGSLRAFLKPLSPNPILVASHGHYDHLGSNFEFPERLVHPAEAKIVAHPTFENTYADLLLATEDFSRLPWKDFRAEEWVLESAPATGLLQEGDTLDLGDRQLTVLHTPGHSWGSISLWEEVTGFLFCADAVYEGEIFDHLPCSDIPTYVTTMQRLRDWPVKTAFPGHGPLLSQQEFQNVIDAYLSRRLNGKD